MEEPTATMAPETLERWIRAFRGPLIGLIASWRSDWRTAEELAQDTFAEAWVSRGRFVGDPQDLAAVGPWLRGIAFHLHSAARRRAGRDGRAASENVPSGEAELAAPTPEPEDERRARLARAFTRLSQPHQTVLRMHYLEETSTSEVAALLGITPKAVEGRLYQARKSLRVEVERVETPTRGVSS